MFSCRSCQPLPERGGQGAGDQGVFGGGGGLVEVEGRAVWGGEGGVYILVEKNTKWERVANGVMDGATLAVCGDELVCVGGLKDGGASKEVEVWRGGRWTSMSNMLLGCWHPCVFRIGGRGLVVIGGWCGGGVGLTRDVQVFDGKTWHFGPPLPVGCWCMSAVVHGDLVFVVGGLGMKRAVWSANITDLVRH